MSFQRNSLLGRSVQADPFKTYIPTGFQKKSEPVTNVIYDTLDTQLKSRTTFKPVYVPRIPITSSISPYPYAALSLVGSAIAVYYMLKK